MFDNCALNSVPVLKPLIILLMAVLPVDTPASMYGKPGFQAASIDHDISPAENFYLFANGNWLRANPVPESESRWGTFDILRDNNTRKLRYILEAAAENTHSTEGSEIRKIGDFFATGMDLDKANQLGISPIRPELDLIAGIASLYDLQNTLAHLQLHGIDALFGLGQMQDFTDNTRIIAVLDQGGLGLPDRDYYFRQDSKSLHMRNEYLRHLSRLFRMLGNEKSTASSIARTILKIETAIAKASLTRSQRRDPAAIYHLVDQSDLDKLMPSFSWKHYFRKIGIGRTDMINLTHPPYFRQLDALLKRFKLDDWKNYLRWRLLAGTSRTLSSPFVDLDFGLRALLTGSKEQKPRWKQVIDETNRILGFAVGRIYVNLYFPPQSRQRVMTILGNVRTALREELAELDWLSNTTRQSAIAKLDNMRHKVGYPDNWRDYSTLIITRDSYARNVLNGNAFLVRRELDKIDNPNNTNEWLMTPQSVNAYYSPSMNEIVFPAGILQPPFFDSGAPESLNYGAIGAVIGHEISHGFDDQGSQFDANGNVKNWWTEKDRIRFITAAECISKQFDSYIVDGDAQVQGSLVKGEAIADLAGLKLAWQALNKAIDVNQLSPGYQLPESNLFFLGFAHVWAASARPEYLRTRVLTDPHPPAMFRVNGTLYNFPPFGHSYDLKYGDPLYNATPCKIW
jgi:putative endopeptidase